MSWEGIRAVHIKTTKHGTQSMYQRGCRCETCRAAMAVYRKERAAAQATGGGDYVVSADLAREHLLWLKSQGVGKKAICDAARVDEPRLRRIRAGELKRIRMSTEQRILRVDPCVRMDGALVPAGPTKARLEQLYAMGYTREQIAPLLAEGARTVQIARAETVTVRTEFRVEKLFQRIVSGRAGIKPALFAIVSGERTWAYIEELQQMGYTRAAIWRMLGGEGTTLRISRRGVRVMTARAVEQLYYTLADGNRSVA